MLNPSPAYKLFQEIGNKLKDAVESQMFGKKCFKTSSKPFVCFQDETMIFKLSGQNHSEAMALENSKLYDPSGSNRPMKEWVQVRFEHADLWLKLAAEAYDYVNLLNSKIS